MKNILRNKRTQIFLALLIIFTLHIQIFTHPAFARSSGGGKLAEFDEGKFWTSVGIGLASSAIGNVVSSGISAGAGGVDAWAGGTAANGVTYGGASGALSSYGSVGTWMASYNSMAALGQLGSGVSMMGQQQGWDTSTTVLVSSIAQGAVGGVLNPSSTLGLSSATAENQVKANAFSGLKEAGVNNDLATKLTYGEKLVDGTRNGGLKVSGWEKTMISAVPNFTASNSFKAATVGAISGAVEGTILAANVDSNGRIKPWISAASGLAGSFVGGVVSSGIMVEVIPNDSGKGFHEAGGFGEAAIHGGVQALSSIPSRLIGMGVSNITKDMNRQDTFMTRQAFRGVYPIAGTVYKHELRDPILEEVGLEHYTGYNGTAGTDSQHVGQSTQYQTPQIETQVQIDPGVNLIDTRQW